MPERAWTDPRIDDLKENVDGGFKKVDERFDKVDERFEKMDEKMDARFNRLDDKFDKKFDQLLLALVVIASGAVPAVLEGVVSFVRSLFS